MHHRLSRLLVFCIVLSIVLHFTIGPVLVWLFGNRRPAPALVVFVTRSTTLRIAHRTRPAPPRPRLRRAPPAQTHRTPAQPRRHVAAARPELARIDRAASPRPQATPATVALDLPQQTQAFEKTIARLRESQDPVLGAIRPIATPEAEKSSSFNIAGAISREPHAQGILQPIRGSPWHDGGYDYYYVRYWVEYADGTTETGIVPWPIRYLPRNDPFRLGLLHIALPIPLPDYRLPPGTTLHPLVAYCFEHRTQLTLCPIMHD